MIRLRTLRAAMAVDLLGAVFLAAGGGLAGAWLTGHASASWLLFVLLSLLFAAGICLFYVGSRAVHDMVFHQNAGDPALPDDKYPSVDEPRDRGELKGVPARWLALGGWALLAIVVVIGALVLVFGGRDRGAMIAPTACGIVLAVVMVARGRWVDRRAP